MAGLNKRVAGYVPYAQRVELDKLSKADLMEIAYSLALRLAECDWQEAYQTVKSEYEILGQMDGRKLINLTDNVEPLSRDQQSRARIAAGTAPDWLVREFANYDSE